MKTRTSSLAITLAASVALGAAILAACSSSSNPQPTTIYTFGDAAVDATSDATNAVDGNTNPNDASGNVDAPSNPDDSGLDAGVDAAPVDAASCSTDGGCWGCTPTTTTQFLNQCTGSTCTPFPNASRLPAATYDGSVPPLN